MAKHTSTAKVVDGSLVLSLPDAVTPVVMRLSLEEAKSASFTVLEKKDLHVLTVQFSEKDSRDIAPYANKEQAIAALMETSAALEKGSRVYSARGGREPGEGNGMALGALKWAGALSVLFILIWFVIPSMGRGLPQAPLSQEVAEGSAPGIPTTQDPRTVTGAPVSADDFLRRAE